jgi:hypothetical protein
MKLSRVIVILLFATVVIMGCGDDNGPTTPANPTMDGTWQGVAQGLAVFVLELSQSGTTVTGDGTISDATRVDNVTVDGSNVYPDVTLTISIVGYNPITFTGSFSDDNTVSGVLNGSGFVDEPLTLVKQ